MAIEEFKVVCVSQMVVISIRPLWNPDQMTIKKTHPTLIFDETGRADTTKKCGFCPPQQALRKPHWESDFIISCLISNLTWMCKSQNSSCKEEMQVNTSMGSFYSSWMMWGPISTYRVTMNPHTKPDPVHILIRNWIFKPIFRHISKRETMRLFQFFALFGIVVGTCPELCQCEDRNNQLYVDCSHNKFRFESDIRIRNHRTEWTVIDSWFRVPSTGLWIPEIT